MKNIIDNIRNSYKASLAVAEDGLYTIKTLYFFKGLNGVREYINDKVSLATACLRNKNKSKKD